jgi:hypothetical protein
VGTLNIAVKKHYSTFAASLKKLEEEREIKLWFEEALNSDYVTSYCDEEIFYKGFSIKIVEVANKVFKLRMYDTRTNDFYSEVRDTDKDAFRKNGFVMGADLIMHDRDCIRERACRDEILRLSGVKMKCVEDIELDKTFFTKKIKNLQNNMNNLVTNYFSIIARKRQIENKYK